MALDTAPRHPAAVGSSGRVDGGAQYTTPALCRLAQRPKGLLAGGGGLLGAHGRACCSEACQSAVSVRGVHALRWPEIRESVKSMKCEKALLP